MRVNREEEKLTFQIEESDFKNKELDFQSVDDSLYWEDLYLTGESLDYIHDSRKGKYFSGNNGSMCGRYVSTFNEVFDSMKVDINQGYTRFEFTVVSIEELEDVKEYLV